MPIQTSKSPTLLLAIIAGFAGGFAWIIALMILFGPAQAILTNPNYQSEKFLYVVSQLEPLPHAAETWWILPIGLLIIGMLYGIVYHFIRKAFDGESRWFKGMKAMKLSR